MCVGVGGCVQHFCALKIIQIWRHCEILMKLKFVLATFKPQINSYEFIISSSLSHKTVSVSYFVF